MHNYNIIYYYKFRHNKSIIMNIDERETPGYLTRTSNKCVRQQKSTANITAQL